jgi:hypothetical protein
MAVIKTGQVIVDIRGSIGGVTFSRNGSGAFVRNKVQPIDPNTPGQGRSRARFGTLSSSWRALTPAQRDSWIAAAPNYPYQNPVGDTIFLTGSQLFQSVNSVYIFPGSGLPEPDKQTISEVPPTFTIASFYSSIQDSYPILADGSGLTNSGGVLINLPGGNPSIVPGELFTVYATPIVSAGKKSSAGLEFHPVWSAEADGGWSSAPFVTEPNAQQISNFWFFYNQVFGTTTSTSGAIFVKMVRFIFNNFYPVSMGPTRVPIVPA